MVWGKNFFLKQLGIMRSNSLSFLSVVELFPSQTQPLYLQGCRFLYNQLLCRELLFKMLNQICLCCCLTKATGEKSNAWCGHGL